MGVTNHLLNGMILQVPKWLVQDQAPKDQLLFVPEKNPTVCTGKSIVNGLKMYVLLKWFLSSGTCLVFGGVDLHMKTAF